MNAVVVELKNNVAAVLSDDGCVVTIKNNDYEIGQIIQIKNPSIRFTKKIGMLAASAAAIVICSVGTWAYASPYTYVSIDVNPSIEFTVNRFDHVLHVNAVNDDGEEILNDITLDELKHKTIQEALTNTVDQISEAGYFDGEMEGGIIIATSSDNMDKAEDLANELQQTIEQEITENGDDVEVEAISVDPTRVEEAKELGVTPGKLNLVEKLQAVSSNPDSVDIEEWLNKPVKDIMKATKDCKKATKNNESSSKEENYEEDQSLVGTDQKVSQDTKQSKKENQKSHSNKANKSEVIDQDVKASNNAADNTVKNGKNSNETDKSSNQPTKKSNESTNTGSKDTKKQNQGTTNDKKSDSNTSSAITEENTAANKVESEKDQSESVTEETDQTNSDKTDKTNGKSQKSGNANDLAKDTTETANGKVESDITESGGAAQSTDGSTVNEIEDNSQSTDQIIGADNGKASDKTDTNSNGNSADKDNNNGNSGSNK
ncbi:MAG: hypothetical protein PHF63_03035 [Herbinix sp.]|nr:hypothetical protein [Herbinix sp.]